MSMNCSHGLWQPHILMDGPAVVSATEIKGRGLRAEVAEWNWSSRSATARPGDGCSLRGSQEDQRVVYC